MPRRCPEALTAPPCARAQRACVTCPPIPCACERSGGVNQRLVPHHLALLRVLNPRLPVCVLSHPHLIPSSLRRIEARLGRREMASEIMERDGAAEFAEIVVIRHGETTWNASKIIQGHLESELNEVGKQQAIAVADRLSKEPKFAAIYSSDLKRAAETANIIANSCNLAEVVLDSTLRERHLGDIQGLTLCEAAKLKPKAYLQFCSTKRDQEIQGGGESRDQLHDRCTSSLEKIAEKHKGERVIVVTHGGVLRELYKHAAPGRLQNGRVLNTSINVFHIFGSGNKWILKTWGDVSHLQATKVLETAFGGDSTSG